MMLGDVKMTDESRKAYMREYNRTHREQVNASQKKYRAAHPDRVKESMRKSSSDMFIMAS